MWQGILGPDHKRKHLKTYLQIAQTALRDRAQRCEHRLASLRSTVLGRFRSTYAPYLPGIAADAANGNSLTLDARTRDIYQKRYELLEQVFTKSVFVKDCEIEQKAITIFAEKIDAIIGNIGLTEKMFETGSLIMANGRAKKFAEAFTRKEKQLWGTTRLQGYRVNRALRTTYPVIEREESEVRRKLRTIHDDIVQQLGAERIEILTKPPPSVAQGFSDDNTEVRRLFSGDEVSRLAVRNVFRAFDEINRDELLQDRIVELFTGADNHNHTGGFTLRPKEYFVVELFYENPFFGVGCDLNLATSFNWAHADDARNLES